MRPTYHVEFLTPKKVGLHGLWVGPRNARRVVIWVHGLGSTLFSKLSIADEIINRDTAVLAFNNRGHDKVAYAKRGKKSIPAGAAHEIFNDSADDIEGAVRFAKGAGAKEIFLAGHSTGCQKSVYWGAKKGSGVKGIILLAPISDYTAEIKKHGAKRVAAGVALAQNLIKRGKPHELLPAPYAVWPNLYDAQRYVSLYSGASSEETFPYWAPERRPVALREVKLPILTLLAEKDEYRDRPSIKMADWFAEHLKVGDQVIVVPQVGHSFKGAEKAVAKHIHKFMKDASQ